MPTGSEHKLGVMCPNIPQALEIFAFALDLLGYAHVFATSPT